MYRATTPTLTYNLSGALPSDFEEMEITLSQDGEVLVTKTLEDCTVEESTLQIELTQEEANRFKKGVASTQIRAITPEGRVHASYECEFYVSDVLDDDIMEVPDE